MLKLNPFRKKIAGLPDLFPYAALVDDGVILGKDGSLLAGFFFRGTDVGSASNSERNMITARVNQYLSRLGGECAVWVDAARIPAPDYPAPETCHFPDKITALIDAERREMFKEQGVSFQTDYALFIQYTPMTRRDSKINDMMYDDDQKDKTSLADRNLINFKRKLDDFQDGIGDLLHMSRMKGFQATDGSETYLSDQLVNYLHFAITGETIALRVPDCPMYLDAWLGYGEFWPGDIPRLNDQYIAVVSIDGFPGFSYPGVMDMLDNFPIEYRWSSRFIFLEQHDALKMLNQLRKKWKQSERGFVDQIFKTNKGTINTDAIKMTQQTEQAINDLRSGAVSYGYYTTEVVLMSSSRELLEEKARYVRREIERKGFSTRRETVNTVEAWLGSLPGLSYPNVRRPLIHTLNLAELLPLASSWPGLEFNPCDFFPDHSPALIQAQTEGTTVFRLNLHVGDVGHTCIFGPTGAGKSTLLGLLTAQFPRYQSRPFSDGSVHPATVTAFDKGYSLYALCQAVGGRHYDFGADENTLRLCPLADIDNEKSLSWAAEWIGMCYLLQQPNIPLTPEDRAYIRKALILLRAEPRGSRSIMTFCGIINGIAPNIGKAMEHYSLAGAMGHILDGTEDIDGDAIADSHFSVFEMESLMEMGAVNAIPVLLYLFHRVEKALVGQPALLTLDEAWTMLGHKVFSEEIRKWLKEMRKKNCSVVMATQSLSDAVNSGLFDVIVEQCPTKILLPNVDADKAGSASVPGPLDYYKMFGLNAKEITLLKTAKYKHHYYYSSPYGRRMFSLGLRPLALSFVAVSSKQDVATVRSLIAEYGEDWPLKWLEMREVDYERYTK